MEKGERERESKQTYGGTKHEGTNVDELMNEWVDGLVDGYGLMD